jgi:hypothetical protein
MNNKLFNEMISGFVEAKKYRAGKKAKMRLKKFFFDFCNFPVKALRLESRRGQPGRRGDSRGIAVPNDKRCPRRAGLSALSRRGAEPHPKPPEKTRFTCDTWCE